LDTMRTPFLANEPSLFKYAGSGGWLTELRPVLRSRRGHEIS
jgi:hypothetical protein